MRNQHIRRSLIALLALPIAGAALYLSWRLWFDPYRGTAAVVTGSAPLEEFLTAAAAKEDLAFIARRVAERHPACTRGLPEAMKEAYEREFAALDAADGVTVLALWQSAARMLAPLGDAHTGVRAVYGTTENMPFSFTYDGDALVVASGAYKGQIVAEIGGISADALYERFRAQFSYELESYARRRFSERIHRADYLGFVGVDPADPVAVTFADGQTIYCILEEPLEEASDAQPAPSYALFDDVALFTLPECAHDQAYRDALRAFFTDVRDAGIGHVILDLRDNPGGNSLVADEFIRYLPVATYDTFSADVRFGPILWKNKRRAAKNRAADELTFSGAFYVLTSTTSFSAAVDFATLLSDNDLCTVVGEVPGNMPTSYGDILSFQTPNAKLLFTVSYKRFVRPDADKSDQPLIPDVPASADAAMDEALQLISAP